MEAKRKEEPQPQPQNQDGRRKNDDQLNFKLCKEKRRLYI